MLVYNFDHLFQILFSNQHFKKQAELYAIMQLTVILSRCLQIKILLNPRFTLKQKPILLQPTNEKLLFGQN